MRLRQAAAAGIALALLAGQASGQSLGRLFTTSEERTALDDIREDPDFGRVAEPAPEAQREEGPSGPVVPHITINGVVFRSSGLNASWINGANIPGSATREGIKVQTSRLERGGRLKLVMPGGLETVQIKPGQKIDLTSGGVFEPYEVQAGEEADLFEAPGKRAEEAPPKPGAEPLPDAEG